MTRIPQFFAKTLLDRQGRTRAEVDESLYGNLEHYLMLANGLTESQFLTPIQPSGWTPPNITDHLCRANGLYLAALSGVCEGEAPLELPVGRVSEAGKMLADTALPNAAGCCRKVTL